MNWPDEIQFRCIAVQIDLHCRHVAHNTFTWLEVEEQMLSKFKQFDYVNISQYLNDRRLGRRFRCAIKSGCGDKHSFEIECFMPYTAYIDEITTAWNSNQVDATKFNNATKSKKFIVYFTAHLTVTVVCTRRRVHSLGSAGHVPCSMWKRSVTSFSLSIALPQSIHGKYQNRPRVAEKTLHCP